MKKLSKKSVLLMSFAFLFAAKAQAASITIGEAENEAGIHIKAVYLQSVLMTMGNMDMTNMQAPCNIDVFMKTSQKMSSGTSSGTMQMSGEMKKMPNMKSSSKKMPQENDVKIEVPPLKTDDIDLAAKSYSSIHLSAYITANEQNQHAFRQGEFIPYLNVCYKITKHDSDYINQGYFMPMLAADGPHYGANATLDGPGKYKVEYFISAPQNMHRHMDKETGVPEWWQPFSKSWDFIYVGTGKKGAY
ncbi:iron transporter [Kiloniella litopenaei]|uniref:iron transporter n=1 Tax=Kiloniella litopenaei TaxID=1549748 RepID=UPI003BAB5185